MRNRSSSVKSHPADALPPDGTNVLFDVWLLTRTVTGALDDAIRETGLSADEFGVYSVLTKSDTMTPTELARWMAAPPTTVSSYVKRFEARGHVAREANPLDGRSYVLRLTPAGRRVHAEATKAFIPVLRRVIATLGTHHGPVRDSLRELREAVDVTGG